MPWRFMSVTAFRTSAAIQPPNSSAVQALAGLPSMDRRYVSGVGIMRMVSPRSCAVPRAGESLEVSAELPW